MEATPPAIDVHAHTVTPAYRAGLAAAGISRPDGFPHIPEWSFDDARALMDSVGIEIAILSVSSPGIHFGDDAEARALARAVNEEMASGVADAPGRFGFVAALPLPDVDGALEEIRHAFEDLHADGVGLLTNAQGAYVGDPRFEEVMAELDRRAAVVVLHPTSPPGWESVALGYPRPMIEFPFDTTRSVVNLVLTRTVERHARIRFIVPHSGSALPVLADRAAELSALLSLTGDEPVDVVASLQSLYYDLTGPTLPRALPALLGLVGPERLLYGSDYPFPPPSFVQRMMDDLMRSDVLGEADRARMLRGNALDLFPRFRTAGTSSS